ncbi:MAG: AtpZ/AtpI family protein [Candidatus Margulisiibacteriota bacterium]
MNLFKYSDIAFTIAGSIVAPPLVGILLGRWIDGYFKIYPAFTLVLLFLGIIAGLRSLMELADKAGKEK